MGGHKDAKLAGVIGDRIAQAIRDSGIATRQELAARTGLAEKAIRRYIAGEHLPQLPALLAIADACRVSLDWLVLGRQDVPAAYFEFVAGPHGADAPDEARAFLRTLPTFGYHTTPRFYEHALVAWKYGLSHDDAARAARATAESEKP